ncbi:sensor histidine kinase [Streptomyces sp. NPDC090022]|uniref:sensor histidine kinase n=1 Tax=Streptomyces sp. NPDC090022 TaxID=3365920 RepID=UPI00382C90C2
MARPGGQTRAVAAGVLQERTRLAAELHDTVAQGLTGLHLLLDAADRQWTQAPGQARLLVRQAALAAREHLAEARRLIHDLAPPALEHGTLADAVHALCVRAEGGRTEGLRTNGSRTESVRFRLEGDPRPLAAPVEAAALHAAQGALANVARHAHARSAVVTLTYLPYALGLDVWDDGVGFDPAAVRRPDEHGGHGLRLLRRRIADLGGTATVESTPGGGTVVSVTLPAPASPAVPR